MNALTPTPNSTPAKPISPVLSPELIALLDDTGSPDEAARHIADTPALLSEAKATVGALQAVAMAKAGRPGVKAVIGRRLATYPQPQRTEAEWDGWWADYFDVLEDVALASLEAAMRAYVAMPDSEFMPKPGKLRELAFTAPCRSLQRFYRAKRAIQFAEAPALTGEPVKRADPDEVKAMLADFKARAVPHKPLSAPIPYSGGHADERGITPQMREVMARRAERRA